MTAPTNPNEAQAITDSQILELAADKYGIRSPDRTLIAFARALLAASEPASKEDHTDDAAVDRFALAMKAKLAEARAKGRGGWDDPTQCAVEYLSELLHSHVIKGDPVDVANFCMMLQQRGSGIVASNQPTASKPEQEPCVEIGCGTTTGEHHFTCPESAAQPIDSKPEVVAWANEQQLREPFVRLDVSRAKKQFQSVALCRCDAAPSQPASAPLSDESVPSGWISANERLPDVKNGREREFNIVVRRARDGGSHVMSACYLNAKLLMTNDDDCPEDGSPFTGWYLEQSDDDWDTSWNAVETQGDVVINWQPLPPPPIEAAPVPGEKE